MNFLNFFIGTGLTLMGLYTFSISSWDWISTLIAASQLIVGIYFLWIAFKRPDVVALPLPILV